MELKKKKYKKNEVETLIEGIKAEYELKFIEQRDKLRELVKENNNLKTELEVYTDKEELILSTLLRAEQNAKDMEEKLEVQYQLELKRLKNFSKKWDEYFNGLKEKYPHSPETKKALDVNKKLNSLSNGNAKAKDIVSELENTIDDGKKFDPKSKIKDYIAATGDNGFNMDEVLNPGSLKLEDLCRELGLIEENE